MEEKIKKLQDVIGGAFSGEGVLKTDQIVGEPIENQRGQTVVPLSQVTVAIIGGGGEYGDVKVTEKVGDRFAGGAVTICQIKPTSFIINNGDGYEIVQPQDSLRVIAELISRMLKKINDKV